VALRALAGLWAGLGAAPVALRAAAGFCALERLPDVELPEDFALPEEDLALPDEDLVLPDEDFALPDEDFARGLEPLRRCVALLAMAVS
jgi:hypothetical protein